MTQENAQNRKRPQAVKRHKTLTTGGWNQVVEDALHHFSRSQIASL